jgi:hypothetical protein
MPETMNTFSFVERDFKKIGVEHETHFMNSADSPKSDAQFGSFM